ncbi:MAG TPA: hypothetical protein VLC09_12050 [Polyangiaceae bacterium]|nr:hypothetical protein [Polyangiaceae bacterium]
MRRTAWPLFVLPAALLFAASCGPELDSIASLETLRIIGLRKSAPYARPGETVKLELLWEDGASPTAASPIERFIGFWCVNPPGDLFGQCLTQIPTIQPQFVFDGDELDITMPTNAVRPAPDGSGAPPYGIAFVFYGVCAGHLTIDGQRPSGLGGALQGGGGALGGGAFGLGGAFDGGSASLVPSCVDDDGNELGSKDFVVGYSAIYAYDTYRNANPILTGFRVNGQDGVLDCLNDECVGRPFTVPETSDCPSGAICVDTCEDDGAVTCPPIAIDPIIDPASAEPDDIAREAYGEDLDEGLWVSYFTDRGGLAEEVRLVNDASTGWAEDPGTDFFAPKEPGPVRMWAVVRDSRGGVAWLRLPVYAR